MLAMRLPCTNKSRWTHTHAEHWQLSFTSMASLSCKQVWAPHRLRLADSAAHQILPVSCSSACLASRCQPGTH